MPPDCPSRQGTARRMGAVAWDHDGVHQLTMWAGAGVPAFDDPMIRSALLRCARGCERIDALDRALKREMWTLGYTATIEAAKAGAETADVVIAAGR
jgi:hypothetical protein